MKRVAGNQTLSCLAVYVQMLGVIEFRIENK